MSDLAIGVGWSKMSASQIALPMPATPIPSVPRPVPNDQPPAATLQKTEMGKISIPVPMPPRAPSLGSQQPAASGPAPVMLGDEVMAKPIERMPDFKTVLDDKIAAASKFAPTAGTGAKPAVLEFGGMKTPIPPKPAAPAPRTVNYSDVPQGQGRQVLEMTATPQLPRPPKPPGPSPMAGAMVPPPLPPNSTGK